MAQTIEAFGRLAATSCPGCAVRMLAYGDARRRELQSKHTPHESAWNEEALKLAKDEISEEFFKGCWRKGAKMTGEEAVECALRERAAETPNGALQKTRSASVQA